MIKNILKILNIKTIIAFIVYLVFRNDNKSFRAYEIKEESKFENAFVEKV